MNPLEEVLKEISSKPNLNKENIIYEVKNALQAKDPGAYDEWKEDGFNVDHVFYGKDALLHLAAEYGNIEMAEALIKSGVNVDAVGNFGKTSLHYTARHGEIEIMKVLIENGANVSAVDDLEDTPLHTAAQEAPERLKAVIVKVLIENGADVNAVDQLGETPLYLTASLSGSIDAVRVLIENGADVNVVNNLGGTPLHLAAQEGCVGIAQILIENGANINAINEYDEDMPLHFAAQNNHLEVVKYLVDKGADISAKNVSRKTPLDCAKEKGYGEIVEYLTDVMARMPHNKDEALQVYQDEYFDDDAFLADYYSLREKKTDERKEEKPLKKKNWCSIQSYQRQGQDLFKFISHFLPNIEIKPARQGLYLPSFEERGVEVNGKCVAITRCLSQALFLYGNKSFFNNLETSAKIYERIAQGKQISEREEREVFAFSKLLNNFERQLDFATNSLPSSLIHTQGYKTFSDLSNYITEVKGDFAIHLVTSNHVVAIYRIGDNYVYFDSNAAFVSGLKGVDQLVQVVEKGIKSAGYKVEEKGFLVEHFDVARANNQLPDEDKQVLTKKEIKTERQLLAEQDRKLGFIKINGQELSRVQLYDFGTKINVEGGVPLLISADMSLSSKKFQDYLDKKEVSMTAREYLDSLKNSKNAEEATKFIPFIGSKHEIEEAEQIRRPKQSLLELAKETINYMLVAVFLTSASRLADNRPRTCLNDPVVDKQLQRSL